MEFAVLGSDSEDEMVNKIEYIQALRDVQAFDGTISLSVSDLPRFPPGHKPIPNPQHLQKSSATVPKTNAKTAKPEKGRKLSHEKNPAISQMPKASNQPVPTSTSA